MYKLITSTFLAAAIASGATAQNQIDGDIIPGQRVFKVPSYQAAVSLLNKLGNVFGSGNVSFVSNADGLNIYSQNIYTVKYPPPQNDDEEDYIEQLFASEQDSGDLIWNEANRIINAHGQTGSLWVSGMGINETSYQSQYSSALLGLQRTHLDLSRGKGTLVAVIDTGIDPTHPALLGKVSEQGYNAIVSGGETDDSGVGVHAGHGTFVAGLVSLVAPEARLLPVTVLRPDGTGLPVDIADGINYAVSEGAHVIVLALGTTVSNFSMISAIDNALARGITVVAAAGNTLPSPPEPLILFPASYTGTGGNGGVVAVGASDKHDVISVFSNYHEDVDIYAPGTSYIQTNGLPDPNESVIGPLPGGLYAAANGTSFSAGLVGGLAALVRAQERDWPNVTTPVEQIPLVCGTRMLISSTMIDLPPLGPSNPEPTRPRMSSALACQFGLGLTITGDIDGDNKVDGRDLSLLLGDWGPLPNNGSLHGSNLAGGDIIDGGDLSLILGNWTSSGM